MDEEVLVVGFADTPKGETVKYLFLNPVEENQFHPWKKLGPVSEFSLVPPADDRTTVRMGLQCAVDMNRDTRRFSPDASMVMVSTEEKRVYAAYTPPVKIAAAFLFRSVSDGRSPNSRR